jgi:hypothetical protein
MKAINALSGQVEEIFGLNKNEPLPERTEKNRLILYIYLLVINPLFNLLIMTMIMANVIVLALDRYNIEKEEFDTLETLNRIIYWIFLVEMLLKLAGLGLKEYCIDRFNLFDALIVVLSTVEVSLFYSEI